MNRFCALLLGLFILTQALPASTCRQKSESPVTPLITGIERSVSEVLARVYDPQTGRFLSADVVVQDPNNLQSYNRYSYCMNNPLVYVDPTGYAIVINGTGNGPQLTTSSINTLRNSNPAFNRAYITMRDSPHTHTIQLVDANHPNPVNGHKASDAQNASNGTGCDTITYFDPSGVTDNAGRHYSAEEELAHEFFSHGYDKDQGKFDTSTNPNSGVSRCEEDAVSAQNLYLESTSPSATPRTNYGNNQVENPDGSNSQIAADYQADVAADQAVEQMVDTLQDSLDQVLDNNLNTLINAQVDLQLDTQTTTQ